MEERAALVGATVVIDSAIGRGTTVLVRMAAAASTAGAIGQA
jgi:signal transduction histidine kinase